MAKISLAGFKDPVRRPRFIIWTFVVVLVLAAVVVIALGATSTRWFCAQVCHKVQDDTITAYEASAHSEISCMACHEPVNANTIVFVLAKMKSVGELYTTVTKKYELPLNAGSALSLHEEEMGDKMCVQCHSSKRAVTPSPGILIDHKVHEEKGVWCTVCHNRTAHNEVGAPPKLIGPDGKANKSHPDFMKMDACFRCHDLAGKKQAPGVCSGCHTAEFKLLPASHETTSWSAAGHGGAGIKADEKVSEEETEAKKLEEEGVAKNLATPVNSCETCHVREKFCDTCHGIEMPHTADFKKEKTHGAASKKSPQVCVRCHVPGTDSSCAACHHGKESGWTFDSKTPWLKQHTVPGDKFADKCRACHEEAFCSHCHVAAGKKK